MQTLWVYTDRVAGTIQELSPTPSNPTSVKVAGQTYEIETASAAYELSDLGSYQVGDTVTLLLGRNGGVAAVAAASASQDGSKIGIVTNLSRGTYSGSGANSSYTADTVTILATDGRTYSYQWTTDYFKLGNLVQLVLPAEEGSVVLTAGSLTGERDDRPFALSSLPFQWEGEFYLSLEDLCALLELTARREEGLISLVPRSAPSALLPEELPPIQPLPC